MAKTTETEEYFAPSEKGVKNAIQHGIEEQWAKLGFDIANDICGVHVRRLYYAYEPEHKKAVPSHEACARKAKELGLCNIIPVDKLPDCVPEDLRKAIWIDTPENRAKLKKYFNYRSFLHN